MDCLNKISGLGKLNHFQSFSAHFTSGVALVQLPEKQYQGEVFSSSGTSRGPDHSLGSGLLVRPRFLIYRSIT